MNLPKRNNRHQYEIELGDKRIIKYSPWLVKNEQEYMYATEGLKDKEEYIPHIEELLSKCVSDDINFKDLSDVDFLKLAIDIRKKSKGSEHEIMYTCGSCKHINTNMVINLDEDVIISDFKNKPIVINELEFNIKELTREELAKINKIEGKELKKWNMVVHSIKSIAAGDEIFANLSTDSIEKFIGEELTTTEFSELVRNIQEMTSSIAIEKIFKCEKCGQETLIYVDSIADFFV